MNTELTRRAVLVGSTAAAALLWSGCGRRSAGARRAVLALAEEVDLGPAARGLGRAYLDLHPEEADAEALLDLLFTGRGALDPVAMKGRLAERIGRDWIDLETAEVEGWIVSRSEGRFLALVALLSEQVSPER